MTTRTWFDKNRFVINTERFPSHVGVHIFLIMMWARTPCSVINTETENLSVGFGFKSCTPGAARDVINNMLKNTFSCLLHKIFWNLRWYDEAAVVRSIIRWGCATTECYLSSILLKIRVFDNLMFQQSLRETSSY